MADWPFPPSPPISPATSPSLRHRFPSPSQSRVSLSLPWTLSLFPLLFLFLSLSFKQSATRKRSMPKSPLVIRASSPSSLLAEGSNWRSSAIVDAWWRKETIGIRLPKFGLFGPIHRRRRQWSTTAVVWRSRGLCSFEPNHHHATPVAWNPRRFLDHMLSRSLLHVRSIFLRNRGNHETQWPRAISFDCKH